MTVIAEIQGPSAFGALNQLESLWESHLVDEFEVKPLAIAPIGERTSVVHALGDRRPDSA